MQSYAELVRREKTLARLTALEAAIIAGRRKDSERAVLADARRAERFESQDWHLSDEARFALVARAEKVGIRLGTGDQTDRYVALICDRI